MQLPFLDREAESDRLRRAVRGATPGLAVVYGRRRLGKSRLLREAFDPSSCVTYVGDARDSALQREDLADQMSRLVPGFAQVRYPGWLPLLERWWRDAPAASVLVLDEFPSMVRSAPELPELLQKLLDRPPVRPRPLVLCGSSQRMMQGLFLDGAAPLYGRAREVLRLGPIPLCWLPKALGLKSDLAAIDAWAAWGGVPRYWELARDFNSRVHALRDLVLDPLGVLHREPERLLSDEMEQITRASSVLTLVGRGVQRTSEIAARIGIPATSLSRTLANLVDLGFLEREIPWGRSLRETKRVHYRVVDPFMRMWFRFVDPDRSRLESGQVDLVAAKVESNWGTHLGEIWEGLARDHVDRGELFQRRWKPARRWWGPGLDRAPLEIDVVAEADQDPDCMLCGEVKLSLSAREADRILHELKEKTNRCPPLQGKRVHHALWVLRRRGRFGPRPVFTAHDVIGTAGLQTRPG